MKIKNGEFLQGDCLELMKDIPNGSVGMVLADLPYYTTAVDFDAAPVIPLDILFAEYWRVLKPNGAIVLTAAQPFTTTLISAQKEHFKYTWYWKKSIVTGFQNAKLQPLRCVEDVCVFYKEKPTYNPQGIRYIGKVVKNGATAGGETVQGSNLGNGKGKLRTAGATYVQDYTDYPTQVLEIESNHGGFHPTQKPVALFEYLIKTYTDEGETVLDNTAGSGTTAIASENTGRKWICMEMDPKYYNEAVKRVEEHGKNTFDEELFA